MKKLQSHKTFEDFASQRSASRYNPAQVLSYKIGKERFTHTIGAGTNDFIFTYHDGPTVYVLSINAYVWYVGLETYQNGESLDSIFLQSDEEITEILGKKGLDLSPLAIAKRLAGHIYMRK